MICLALRSMSSLYSAFSTGRQLISFWICPARAVFSKKINVKSSTTLQIIILLTRNCLSKIRLPSFTLVSLIVTLPGPVVKASLMWHSRRRKAEGMLTITFCFGRISRQVLFCEDVCAGRVSFHHMHIVFLRNCTILC